MKVLSHPVVSVLEGGPNSSTSTGYVEVITVTYGSQVVSLAVPLLL